MFFGVAVPEVFVVYRCAANSTKTQTHPQAKIEDGACQTRALAAPGVFRGESKEPQRIAAA